MPEKRGPAGLVRDGQLLAVGSFGLCRIARGTNSCTARLGVKDLTVISNNAGVDGLSTGRCSETRQIRKMISSYVARAPRSSRRRSFWPASSNSNSRPGHARREAARGRCRHFPPSSRAPASAASITEGKELREFDGHTYVMERALVPELALVKAWKADHSGRPDLSPHHAQEQSGGGDGRQDPRGRGRGTRRDQAPSIPDACTCPASRIVVNAHPRSASRSARSANGPSI